MLAAVIIIPAELGGYGKIFASRPIPSCCCWRPRTPDNLGAGFAYVTLALGSLLALFLYPHSVTGLAVILQPPCHSSATPCCCRPIRLALALIALLGLHGGGGGREDDAGICRGL